MPSEIMDLPDFSSSSSYFSDDLCFPNERKFGLWKSDNMRGGFAVGAGRASSHSASLNVQPASYAIESNRGSMVGTQYESSLFSSSLSELFNGKLRLSSNHALYGHSVDTVASHYEEEEPFESLEEIEAQTIGNLLPDYDDFLSGVTDGLDCIVQPSGGDDVEELDLFSSVGGMDLGDDCSSDGQNNSDFPGGVSNGQPGESNGSVASEHPSRTLFVRNINGNFEDSELKTLFEQYGDIRTLYTACKHRGFVMISYYDIRAARNAMKALHNRPVRRRKLDIHYLLPKDNPSEKDIDKGTLVVFNLDSSVSNDELHQIFATYGEIKEIRETPQRSLHKFIEFYDVRAAEAALHALNKSDIAGRRIKLEPCHTGGSRRLMQQFSSELKHDDRGLYLQHNGPAIDSNTSFPAPHGEIASSRMDRGTILGVHPTIQAPSIESVFHHGISSSVPNSLPSLVRVESVGNQPGLAESGRSPGQLKFDIQGTTTFHPHSLPEYHNGLTNGVHVNSPGIITANISPSQQERFDNWQFHRVSSNGHPIDLKEAGVFRSTGNGSCSLPGHLYSWNSSYHSQPPGMMWPNSPSLINGICGVHPAPRLHGFQRAPSNMPNSGLPTNNHHVGSAPLGNPSLWDRQHAYAGESPEASGFHPGSLGNVRISNNSLHAMECVSHSILPHVVGNVMELSIPQKNVGLQSQHQRCMAFSGRGPMIPMMNSFDPSNERARSRRNEDGSSKFDNKKQFELDIDRIMRGEDNRTTLMIKNIPNKYTSKMLMAAIDERHPGSYDFIYLPIDFKNKCNVGYAFINMKDPNLIIPFYQAFDGKKWEKFNSEKVASLAYARIQGIAALIAHFQNSSLMNEDKRCRPILFNTDGANAGDQVPFPMGVNVRTRPGKTRTNTHEDIEENQQGSLPKIGNGEDPAGDPCSRKE
ncbi:protein MEI2-like 4 isoform X1 [Juglans microcarpa x Juglans regia]|uniref:protein MEI2-like 4 isoform X1 n=2 Tax=Juglans microcarpa x Juglans regia TaxID=2249226 RepID=UPI001B7E813A|nr:protein MEI2-like 4 isoform X1 [Juglans microcarpa x Juglans regia]